MVIAGALRAAPGHLRADVPVDPGHDQARQWLITELSHPQYAAAQPSWFDRLVGGFLDWLSSLTINGGGAAQGPLIAVIVVVILAAGVTAYLIYGAPRRGRTSSQSAMLFNDDDTRDSATLRSAAQRAAATADWATAIAEMFRCLARSLAERTLVAVLPGTTAHGFAIKAAQPFPAHAERLRAVAAEFDAVRYLGAPGSETSYRHLAALEKELNETRPQLASVLSVSA